MTCYCSLPSLSLCLALLAATVPGGSSNEGRDLQVLYDRDVNLTCSDGNLDLYTFQNSTFQWLLPNGHLLHASSAPDTNNHYAVLDNGTTLFISDVERPDFGLYLCLISVDGVVQASVSWTVNMNGPYYGDMWEKYWPKARVGLMAGAAVFIFLSMLCINLDQFQHYYDKTEEKRMRVDPKPYLPDQKLTCQAYGNVIFNDMPSDSYDSAGVSSMDMIQDDTDHSHAQTGERKPETSF